MDRVIAALKARIEECKAKGEMFTMRKIEDCTIEESEGATSGSTLYHLEFVVRLLDGRFIQVDYQSKDKGRTFSVVPGRSCIKVECSDHSKAFTDSWDERF